MGLLSLGPQLPGQTGGECPIHQLLGSFKAVQHVGEMFHGSEKGFLALLLLTLKYYFLFFSAGKEKFNK